MSATMTEPPFYRGVALDGDGWDAILCDHITEGADTACDALAEYRIEWQHNPEYDADSLAVSGCCEAHALLVDRRQVLRMSTHPARVCPS